jgi:hypothetical protein
MVAPCWSYELQHTVDKFIEANPTERNHELVVKWFPSCPTVDPHGRGGAKTLETLFDKLTKFVSTTNNPVCRAMAGFERIHITVPEHAEQAGIDPAGFFMQFLGERRTVDLWSAPNLCELSLTGSFLTLAHNISLTPSESLRNLTKLSLTGCRISVNDTLALLQSCSRLSTAEFETICDEDHWVEVGSRLMRYGAGEWERQIDSLWITACTNISSILNRIDWGVNSTTTLTVLAHGSDDADENLMASMIGGIGSIHLMNFVVKGEFRRKTKDRIRGRFPNVVWNS